MPLTRFYAHDIGKAPPFLIPSASLAGGLAKTADANKPQDDDPAKDPARASPPIVN
jgi:hypothetical protein